MSDTEKVTTNSHEESEQLIKQRLNDAKDALLGKENDSQEQSPSPEPVVEQSKPIDEDSLADKLVERLVDRLAEQLSDRIADDVSKRVLMRLEDRLEKLQERKEQSKDGEMEEKDENEVDEFGQLEVTESEDNEENKPVEEMKSVPENSKYECKETDNLELIEPENAESRIFDSNGNEIKQDEDAPKEEPLPEDQSEQQSSHKSEGESEKNESSPPQLQPQFSDSMVECLAERVAEIVMSKLRDEQMKSKNQTLLHGDSFAAAEDMENPRKQSNDSNPSFVLVKEDKKTPKNHSRNVRMRYSPNAGRKQHTYGYKGTPSDQPISKPTDLNDSSLLKYSESERIYPSQFDSIRLSKQNAEPQESPRFSTITNQRGFGYDSSIPPIAEERTLNFEKRQPSALERRYENLERRSQASQRQSTFDNFDENMSQDMHPSGQTEPCSKSPSPKFRYSNTPQRRASSIKKGERSAKEREDSSELYRSSYHPAHNPYLPKELESPSHSFELDASKSHRNTTTLSQSHPRISNFEKDTEYEVVQKKYEDMYGDVSTSPFNPKNAEYKIRWERERKEKDRDGNKPNFSKKNYSQNFTMKTPSPSYDKFSRKFAERSTADKYSSGRNPYRAIRQFGAENKYVSDVY